MRISIDFARGIILLTALTVYIWQAHTDFSTIYSRTIGLSPPSMEKPDLSPFQSQYLALIE